MDAQGSKPEPLPDLTVDLPSFGAREYDPKFQGIAESRGYRQNDESNQYRRPERLNYSHEALCDYMIANPTETKKHIAGVFGRTEPWIHRITNSDAFQAFLASRKAELTDPILAESIENQLQGMVSQSIDVLTEKLEKTRSPDLALKMLDIGYKAAGFGARDRGAQNIQNNFVVALPSKSPDAESWAKSYGGTMLEARPLGTTTSFDPLAQPKPMTIAED